MNLRRLVLITVVCLVAVLSSTTLWGSLERGIIRGTVTDQQGAIVPGATVTVTDVDTNVSIHLTTDSAGFYMAPELVPGNYSVSVSLTGFAPVDVKNIAVKANETSTADVKLAVGTTTQHIEVTAALQHVDTTAANFGSPVQERYMEDLPVENRDMQNMVMLIPGVTQSGGPPGTSIALNGGEFGKFPDPSHTTMSMVSVNGSQAASNVWYLDGSINAAQGVDNVVVNPVPDAVSEFQAITDGFAAEYGRTAGGVFSMVLKSGTNGVHGDAYEYNRNSYFEATNPFQATDVNGKPFPPNYANLNQFGGTIGGPVYLPHVYNGKNRTFFFAGWDISFLHEASPAGLYTVPTTLEGQGNFSEFPNIDQYGIYDPMTTKYDAAIGQFVRQPFLNPNGTLATSLPANRINPVGQFLTNTFPAPNYLDPRQQDAAAGGCLNRCNNFQGNYASSQTSHNVVAKIDHEFSEKNKMFGEWLYNPTDYRFLRLPWDSITAPENGFNTGYPFNLTNQVATLGDTWTFSPTLINEFRLSFSRQATYPIPPPSSFHNVAPYLSAFPIMSDLNNGTLNNTPIWSVGGLGGFGAPQQFVWDALGQGETLQDGLAKVHGKHTFKAGFIYRVDQMGNVRPFMSYLGFNSGMTGNALTGQGGSGVAQFLLGAVDQGSPAHFNSFQFYQPASYSSTHDWGFYFQDDYRLRSNLTVNIGLRYDLYGWYKDRWGNASVLNPSEPNPQVPTRLGAIDYVDTPRHTSAYPFPDHKTDIGPRLNFSYSPGSDQKTVIRGGVDYVYTNGMTQMFGQAAGSSANPGFIQFASFNTDATGQGLLGSGVVPAFIMGDGVPPVPPLINAKQTDFQSLGTSNLQIIAYHDLPRDPNVLFWNLQVQRQFPGNFIVTAGYVGSKGTDLVGGEDVLNPVRDKYVLQYKSALNSYIPMPADLAPIWGTNYYLSQTERLYPQWSTVSCEATCGVGGSTDYDGFLLSVERRFSQGLSFKAAYTFQKTIASAGLNEQFSNVEVSSGGAGRNSDIAYNLNQIQNWDCQKCDRGLTSDDIPNIFNIALTYELPFGKGKAFASNANRITDGVIGGWNFATNFNIQDGVPLNVSGPCNSLQQLNADGGGDCRPDLVGDPASGRSGVSRYQLEHGSWFNANAFTPAYGLSTAAVALATTGTPAQKDAYQVGGTYPFYTYGTAALRVPSVRSPGFWDMDAALFKNFKVKESSYFQLRVESYNALNHQSLGLPNTSWCLPPNANGSVDAVHQAGCQFGWIGGVQRDPRAFEFSLKFAF